MPPTPQFRTMASDGSTLLWRKNDYFSYPVGQDEQALVLRGKAPVLLPGFVTDFIGGCDRFRPLEAHIARHADKFAWGSMEIASLRSWLGAAVDCGALISSDDVFSACLSTTGSRDPARLETIGIPTGGDRVDLVERAVESFARNAAAHGRKVRFVISDGSTTAAQRSAFREASRRWEGEYGVEVIHLGEEEKRRFSGDLVRRGCDKEAVEFALFDPLGMGFTCGANRNALLLHQAGKAFCSIDDDVICALAAAPAASSRLRLFSACDPFMRWLFADRGSAVAHAGAVDADFFATHESLLGCSAGELCGELKPADLDLAFAGEEFLRRLWAGVSRVRATFLGHVGDPGIPTSTYYLFYEGENRARLTKSESHYRATLGARSVFTVAPSLAIGDSSTSPGMAMGLDHRELLPPFFPVLHAEDFVFGAALWLCDARALLGHLPVAIRHEPRPGKSILQPSDLGPENRVVVFEFAHLVRRLLLRFHQNESDSIEGRMRKLGEFLCSAADQPLADFTEGMRHLVVEHESARLEYLEHQLREDTDSPEFWREDLEAYLAHVREALTHDDFDIPLDIKSGRSPEDNRKLIQQLFIRYGRLLREWPAMVAAAKEINAEGGWGER